MSTKILLSLVVGLLAVVSTMAQVRVRTGFSLGILNSPADHLIADAVTPKDSLRFEVTDLPTVWTYGGFFMYRNANFVAKISPGVGIVKATYNVLDLANNRENIATRTDANVLIDLPITVGLQHRGLTLEGGIIGTAIINPSRNSVWGGGTYDNFFRNLYYSTHAGFGFDLGNIATITFYTLYAFKDSNTMPFTFYDRFDYHLNMERVRFMVKADFNFFHQ